MERKTRIKETKLEEKDEKEINVWKKEKLKKYIYKPTNKEISGKGRREGRITSRQWRKKQCGGAGVGGEAAGRKEKRREVRSGSAKETKESRGALK